MKSLLKTLLLLGPCATGTEAQYGNGTILGTVTDPSNSAIPNATITVVNHSTGETRTLTSDQSGNSRFPATFLS